MNHIVKKAQLSAMILATGILSLAFSNCVSKSRTTSNESTSVSEFEINNDKTKLCMMEQEYKGNNIAEIPMISYDGSQPALAVYGRKNPEIEMINNEIKNGIMQLYNGYRDAEDENEWIEIKTYPFTSKRLIQFIITSVMLPDYGTDGDLMSFNFDKVNNERIYVETALERLGIDKEFIEKSVQKLFLPSYGKQYVGKVEIAGFRLINDNTTEFFLKMFITNPDADPWDGFSAIYIHQRLRL